VVASDGGANGSTTRTWRRNQSRTTAAGRCLVIFAALLLSLLLCPSSGLPSQALWPHFPAVRAALAAPAPPSWVSFAGDAINVKWDKPNGAASYQLKYVDEVSLNLICLF
jgi:hypothetical protein